MIGCRDPLTLMLDVAVLLGVAVDAEVLEFEVAAGQLFIPKPLDIDDDATRRDEELRFLRPT